MEERLIPLPTEKNTFKNLYISPGSFRRFDVSKKNENPETEKLKAKIFTRELEDLIQKVASKKKILKEPEKFSLIPEGFQDIYSLYQNIYDRQDDGQFVSNEMSNLLRAYGVLKYILLGLNSYTGMYTPLYRSGWKNPDTISMLLLHKENPLFKNEIRIGYESDISLCMENPYFQKYFREENFDDVSRFTSLEFSMKKKKFLLLQFSKSSIPMSGILNILKPIYPIVVRRLETIEKHKEETLDIPLELFHSLKNEFAGNHFKELFIHKISIENFFSSYDRERRKSELLSVIQNAIRPNNKIFEYIHNTFLIISPDDISSTLNNALLNKLGKQNEFKIYVYSYPSNYNNFYLVL